VPSYSSPRYSKPRTLNRPTTRFLCRWVPRRDPKRVYTAKDAARITCYATRAGAKKAEIDRLYRIHCQGKQEERKTAAEAVMEIALSNLADNNESLLEAYRLFLIVNAILLALVLAGRVVPILRPIQIAASAARVSVASVIRVNIRQRAANDALFKQIERTLGEIRKAA